MSQCASPDDVLDAWEYFADVSSDEIPQEMLSIFIPWFLYRWDLFSLSDEIQCHLNGEGSIAEKLLKRSRPTLTAYEVDCLEQGMGTPLSFFKILDTDPGNSSTFVDLLREDQIEMTVKDKKLSLSARTGGIFFGLVFHDNEVVTCEGAAPLMIPPFFMAKIEEFKAELKNKCGVLNADILLESEDAILDLYWSIDEALRRPPIIENTSGELFRMQTVYFDCKDQRQALRSLAPMARDPELISELTGQSEDQELEEVVKFPWLSAKPSKKLNGPIIYGHFEISKTEIKVHVNSNERARRCVNQIGKTLGDVATYRTTVYESSAQHSPSESSKRALQPALPPEAFEALKKLAAENKKKWFDNPIPMLRGESPRQAAKTSEGRAKLENLIEVYSFNHLPQDPHNLANLMNPTEEEIRLELGI